LRGSLGHELIAPTRWEDCLVAESRAGMRKLHRRGRQRSQHGVGAKNDQRRV